MIDRGVLAAAVVLGLTAFARGQQTDLWATGSASEQSHKVIARDGTGFKIELPAVVTGTGYGQGWQVESSYGLVGDFELSCGYDIAKLGVPGSDPAGEVKVGIALNGMEGYELSVGCRPGQPNVFDVMRMTPTSKDTHYNARQFPRTGTAGKLVLRRRGGELVFLAADGPAAPLVELLRYPVDPQTNPRPRIHCFRQHAKSVVPAVVKLTDVSHSGGRAVRGAAVQGTELAPVSAYPVRIAYAGNPAGLLGDFNKGSNQPGWLTAVGPAVRAAPPVVTPHRKDANAYWVQDACYSLSGDFEVTLGYDITKLGPPGPDGYSGPGFGLAVVTDGPLGSLEFKRIVNGKNMPLFSVVRHTPIRTGPTYDVLNFPSDGSPSGRLVLQRSGAVYVLLAADRGAEPTELVRLPFVAGPVPKLRLMFDQGGTATAPLDVKLSELTVRAGKLTDDRGGTLAAVGAAAPAGSPAGEVALDAAPRPQSRKWLYLGLGVAVLAGVGLVFLVHRRRASDD